MHNNINVNVSGPAQPASTYKTFVLKGQVPFATQVTEPNTKYVIKHNFELDADVTIPANCILEFDGGSLSNGTIIGNETKIIASKYKLFNDISFDGSWSIDHIEFDWFGPVQNNAQFDNAPLFKNALLLSFLCGNTIKVSEGKYYFLTPIDVYGVNESDPQHFEMSIQGEKLKLDYASNIDTAKGSMFIIASSSFIYGTEYTVIRAYVSDMIFVAKDRDYESNLFENVQLRNSIFTRNMVSRFNAFLEGRISYITNIENNIFKYNKYLLYWEGNATEYVAVDSTITNNYINGIVDNIDYPYSSGESEMIHGPVILTRIENNFIDFYIRLFSVTDPMAVAIVRDVIVSNNIIDYCYTFTNGAINGLVFTGNSISSCTWEYAKNSAYWSDYNDHCDDYYKNIAWVFFYPSGITNTVIENNLFFYCSFVFVAKYNLIIKSVKIKNNVARGFAVYINTPSENCSDVDIDGVNFNTVNRMDKKVNRFITFNEPVNKIEGNNTSIQAIATSNGEKYYELPVNQQMVGIPDVRYLELDAKLSTLGIRSIDKEMRKSGNINYVADMSNDRVYSCILWHTMSLYNNGLINEGDIIYISDYNMFMKARNATIGGYMDGDIVGFWFNDNFCESVGGAYRFSVNTAGKEFINKTIWKDGAVKRYNGSEWVETKAFFMYPKSGTIKPSTIISNNDIFFDKITNKNIYNKDGEWREEDGLVLNTPCMGIFANRPTIAEGLYVGFRYIRTDSINEKKYPIFYLGNSEWCNSEGTIEEDNLFVLNVKESSDATVSADRRNIKISLASGSEGTIYAQEDGYFATTDAALVTDPKTSMQYTNNTIYLPNDTFDLVYTNKQNIERIECSPSGNTIFSFNTINIKGLTHLNYIKANMHSAFGDISNIPTTVTYLEMKQNDLTGDLSGISGCINLTELSFYGCNNIGGDIRHLASLVSVTAINLGYCLGVTGNIEDFVSGMWGNNRRSGTISLTINNTTVKLHDTRYNSMSIAFSNNGVTITSGGNTIATYDGTNWSYQ